MKGYCPICGNEVDEVEYEAFKVCKKPVFPMSEISLHAFKSELEKELIEKFLIDVKRVKKIFDSGCPIINAFTEISFIIKKWEREHKKLEKDWDKRSRSHILEVAKK